MFKYSTGMFGTCADPLHMGHVATIIEAASQCRRFYVVLSYGEKRDRIHVSIRRKWMQECVGFLDNVTILLLEDYAASKDEYDNSNRDYWKEGADYVHGITGDVDAIWCGADRSETYGKYYPEAEIIEVPRIGGISSTDVFARPYAHWDDMPACVRQYFVKPVLIVGHESCGKSTMVRSLASMYNTVGVQEYGREVCQAAGGTEYMNSEDYDRILLGHKEQISAALLKANRLLFLDTDAYTTGWFARFSPYVDKDAWYVKYPEQLSEFIIPYSLVIFLEPDVPFIQDGLRSEANNTAENRKKLSDQLYEWYDHFLDRNVPIVRVGGNYSERLNSVCELVNTLLEE